MEYGCEVVSTNAKEWIRLRVVEACDYRGSVSWASSVFTKCSQCFPVSIFHPNIPVDSLHTLISTSVFPWIFYVARTCLVTKSVMSYRRELHSFTCKPVVAYRYHVGTSAGFRRGPRG
jgi:hypothetical protein